jgi:3-deoxy-D-manno-octulosonic acid kinase
LAKKITKSDSSVIVYDDTRVSQISADFFRADYWPNTDQTSGKAGGRGAVLFIRHEGDDWVLRHYYRGGLPGKFFSDQFVWAGSTRTRSMREFELLEQIQAQQLPAPAPIAARYVHRGFYYTADLITARLPDVRPLSVRLTDQPVPDRLWQAVGECIARFHFAGFFHADLNAHNIQIDGADRVFLLDWDRGDRRQPGSWRNRNLARLHRSLLKISRDGAVQFDAANWELLIHAYMELWHRLPD